MKYLSLGSGSMGFFIELGVLSKLDMSLVEEISGASAGALLASLFMLARGDCPKILDYALTVPLKQMMSLNIKSLLTTYGLVSQTNIRLAFVNAIQTFMNKDDVTFRELYEHYPKKLHVTAYCIELQRTQYFSVDTTPDESVVDVLCASMAIPFLVSAVKIGPWTFIDGAVEEHDPCACFLERPKEDVLRVCVSWSETSSVVKDYKSYLLNVLKAVLKMRHKYSEFRKIDVTSPGIDLHDFGLSNEDKLKLVMAGHGHKFPDA
jgi:predicted acylesterase/phospholipase RssA